MIRSIAIVIAATALTLLSPTSSRALQPQAACAAEQGCCKICSRGKACGNTCISRDKECHVGRGCACDG
jgi:hypothetical protein